MKRFILLLFIILALQTGLTAQTVKTVGPGGDYPTLKDAFDIINAGTVKGDITLQIVESISEYETAILYESGYGGTSDYSSVTIYPTGNDYIIDGDFDGPLILLSGADYVTIDGRLNGSGSATSLVFTNMNTGSSASTIRFTEEASLNTVKYCTLKGSETGSASGIIYFSDSSTGTGNNGNIIENNKITGETAGRPVNGLYSNGTPGSENNDNIIRFNSFYDFFKPSLTANGTSNGIYISSNSTAWTITGNSFYETTNFAPSGTFTVTYNAIQINNTSGTSFTVSDNFIGGNAASCLGTWTKTNARNNIFYAIYLNVGTGTASNIQNNTIKGFNWSNSSSASWTGIHIAAGDVNIGTTTANTIGSGTGTGSVTVTGGAPGANVYGINIAGGGTVNCENNIIGSITTASSNSNNSTNFTGINKSGSAGTTIIRFNTIGSTSTVNSINASSASNGNMQAVYGINNAGTGNITISSNTIANLTNSTTNSNTSATGHINGIRSSDGTDLISYNKIHNLTIANANTSNVTFSVCGIMLSGNTLKTIDDNTIYNLTNTFSSFAGRIVGLHFNGNSGSNLVSENFIHTLSATGVSSLNARIYGILTGTGTTTYLNNIVSLGGDTQSELYGIYEKDTTTNNNNLYFNSLSVTGSPAAGSKNSYALYSVVSADTRNFRNNILSNTRSNSGASGKHYAISLAAAGASITIDYNDYDAPGTGGTLGYLAGDITTLADWKTATGQDANSINVNPSFINSTGTLATDYMLSGPPLTGITIPGIAEDFNDATRSSPPTIGAFEIGCANPTDGGTIGADQTGCTPFDPVLIDDTAEPSGHMGILEYKWQKSVSSGISGFTDIPSSNSDNYNPGPLTQTTWFKRLARVVCESDWSGAVESNVVMITVNDLPVANAITGGTVFCMDGSLTMTPNATGSLPLTYTWVSSAVSIATVNSSGLAYAVSPGSAAITYTVTDGNSCTATSPDHNVTVNPKPATGLTVGGTGTICYSTGTSISVASSVSGINYQLRNDNADELIGSAVAGDGSTIYLPTGNLTNNTTFNVLAINPITTCSAELIQKATVSIDAPSVGGNVGGTAVITYGSSTGTMTLTGNTGTVQRWEKRYNSGSWTTIINTSATYSETPSSAGTWDYRAVVKNGSCAEANSSELSITVNKAALSVTAEDKSKTYDGLVYSAFTVTYSGFVLGETSSVLGGSLIFSGTAATATNVGSYVITPGGLTSDNYNITYVNGQLTINTAPLTITAVDISKVYDGLVFSSFTVGYSGFVNGEISTVLGGTLTFSGAATTETNVGSYVITPGGLTSTNYSITFVNGQLTISTAPLSITADNKSKTYDGLGFGTFTVTYSGFVNGETSTVLGGSLIISGTAITATNAGSYVITPSGLTSANYNITFVNGQLIINMAALSVTAADKNKVYDGLVYNEFTVTYSGFVNGETSSVLGGTLNFSGTAVAATGAGTYVITPGGLTSGNYNITFINGQLTIGKAPLTVTAADKSKTYNGTIYSPFTVTYIGFVNSETSSVLGGSLSFSGTAATATNAGSYIITPGGLTSNNYTFTFANGSLTISKANLTLTADDKSKVFQAQNPALTFSASGFVNGETPISARCFAGTSNNCCSEFACWQLSHNHLGRK